MYRIAADVVFFFIADKTPIEVAQEAFKLGKKLKRSAAVVKELLERVSLWLANRRWRHCLHAVPADSWLHKALNEPAKWRLAKAATWRMLTFVF